MDKILQLQKDLDLNLTILFWKCQRSLEEWICYCVAPHTTRWRRRVRWCRKHNVHSPLLALAVCIGVILSLLVRVPIYISKTIFDLVQSILNEFGDCVQCLHVNIYQLFLMKPDFFSRKICKKYERNLLLKYNIYIKSKCASLCTDFSSFLNKLFPYSQKTCFFR